MYHKKGPSAIEMLLVIGLVAIIASVLFSLFTKMRDRIHPENRQSLDIIQKLGAIEIDPKNPKTKVAFMGSESQDKIVVGVPTRKIFRKQGWYDVLFSDGYIISMPWPIPLGKPVRMVLIKRSFVESYFMCREPEEFAVAEVYTEGAS